MYTVQFLVLGRCNSVEARKSRPGPLSPDVQHEDRGDENKTHYQYWNGAPENHQVKLRDIWGRNLGKFK